METFKASGLVFTVTGKSSVMVGTNKTVNCNAIYSASEVTTSIVINQKVNYHEIEYNIVEIGSYAFRLCPQITSFSLPESIKQINSNAFDRLMISKDVFNLPPKIEYIGSFAFAANLIQQFVIPETCVFIGHAAFVLNQRCKAIVVHPLNNYYTSDDNGILYDKMKSTLCYVPSEVGKFEMPDGLVVVSVRAFDNNHLINVVIFPSTVSVFKSEAFYCCSNLTEIHILGNIRESSTIFFSCPSIFMVYYHGVKVVTNAAFTQSDNACIYVCNSYIISTFGKHNATKIGYCPDQNRSLKSCAFQQFHTKGIPTLVFSMFLFAIY